MSSTRADRGIMCVVSSGTAAFVYLGAKGAPWGRVFRPENGLRGQWMLLIAVSGRPVARCPSGKSTHVVCGYCGGS